VNRLQSRRGREGREESDQSVTNSLYDIPERQAMIVASYNNYLNRSNNTNKREGVASQNNLRGLSSLNPLTGMSTNNVNQQGRKPPLQ